MTVQRYRAAHLALAMLPRDDGDYVTWADHQAEVARLQDIIDRQRREAFEEQREFQREAREIAAQARADQRAEDEGRNYGRY